MAAAPADSANPKPPAFTSEQKFVVAMLAFLQFTIVLDFMVLSPLGALLMPALAIVPKQFGLVVSAYAVAAAVSGILAAGFADRYDRKKFLLFFYAGFLVGTVCCGLAPNYQALLAARIVTGLFGGVVGAASYAIVADVFPLTMRGRVMGLIMTSFGAAQVLGIPVGIVLATHLGWHAPFLMIAGVGLVVGAVIVARMPAVDAHLAITRDQHPVRHLWKTATSGRYWVGFAATMLLATGGFMLMPFASAFTVNNQHITVNQLPILYVITGMCSMIFGPLIGKLSDRVGKYATFCGASTIVIGVVLYYTQLENASLVQMTVISVVMFACVTGRMAAAGALMSVVPAPQDRGAYMSISSSLQQMSGGVASFVAGLLVFQGPTGRMEHYPRIGVAVSCATVLTIILMYRVHRLVAGAGAAPVAREVLARG
ncbi:MAG TPA: MFS transporter [Lacunisphaera sp.]|nr:MFS transporter [Lacunisphaera sp.]